MDVKELRAEWTAAGQGHVFAHVDELSASEKEALFKQLKSVKPALVVKQLEQSRATPSAELAVKPFLAGKSDEHSAMHWKVGLQGVADGKCAALLLAGGQGTRLKTKSPKV